MRCFLLVYIFLFSGIGFSQNYHCNINGYILDSATKEPIPFVTIKYQPDKGVTSDLNGKYTLKLKPGKHVLEVSVLGYKTQKKSIEIPEALSTRLIDFHLVESKKELNEFIVTAKKYEQKIADETVSTTVIESDIIQEKATTNVKDIVSQIPGLHTQEGQVSIRGGAGFSYGAGSRVLLMLDGVPMLSGDAGDIKWNYLPLESINQIEILKGASSVLYGSSALNGVINIRTQYPTSTPKTNINFVAGMYDKPYKGRDLKWWNGYRGMQGISFYHARQVSKYFDLVVGGNYFNNQSFRMGESEKRGRMNINTKFLNKKINGLFYGVNANAQFSDVDLFFVWKHRDSVLTPSPGTSSSSKNNRFNIDPYIEYFTEKGDKHSLKTRWFNTDNNNQIDQTQSSTSNLIYGDYQFRKNIDTSFIITSGATFVKTLVNSTLYGNHQSSNIALYSQLDKVFFKKLTVSAGVRAEYYKLNSDKEPILPIFRTGLNYKLTKATFVRVSYGQGYRFPSVAEKFASTSIGSLTVFPNPSLEPEKGWSAELGVKQGLKIGDWKGYVDVSGFINEYQNMTEYTFGFYDTTTFEQKQTGSLAEFGASSRNVSKARITGVDFTLAGKGHIGKIGVKILAGYTFMNPKPIDADTLYLSTFSSLTTNYTYDRTLDLNSDTVSDNLKYRFNHLLKFDIQFEYWKLTAGISYRYNSYVHNVDESFNILGLFSGGTFLGELDNYRSDNRNGTSIFDFRLAFLATEKIKISGIINNVFNTEYQTRPGWVMPPRNYVIQANFSF